MTSACSAPIWDDLARRAQAARFEHALRGALPASLAEQALDDPACTWLWRTLREAEAAGLDSSAVLRQAVKTRSFNGARDVARVLDARVRRLLEDVQPNPPGSWTEQIPDMGTAELNRYMAELATAMDDRTRRLGEHTAETQPAWARQALGPVPADPARRADWEQRASLVASYRERYGYAHPERPDRASTRQDQPRSPRPLARRHDRHRRAQTTSTYAAAPTATCGCAAAPTNAKPHGRRPTSPRNCG